MNISKKILLLTCVALSFTHFSRSQTILPSYTCTGSGGAILYVAPSAGITSYSWTKAGGGFTSTSATINQPNGTFSVTITIGAATTLLGPFTIASNIVPTVPTITPATVVSPICGVATQNLTSSAAANYAWKRDGNPITGSTNSIIVTGNDVSNPGTYAYTVSTNNTTTGCTSNSLPVNLKVSPKPSTPSISPTSFTPNLVCGTDTKLLSATSGGTSYVWKRGLTILTNTTNALTVAGNDVPAGGTFTYTVALQNSVGCLSDDSPVGVVLQLAAKPATPVVSPASVVNPICGTATQGLSIASVAGATYAWKRNGSPITGATNTITVTGNDVSTAGTYNYTVSTQNATGCSSDDSAPVDLKVSPKPATPSISPASFTPNLVCGTDTKLLSATPGGIGTSYIWKRGSSVLANTGIILTVAGNDVLTGGTFTYTVALQNSVGCISDDSPSGVVLQLAAKPATPTISPLLVTTPICGVATQALSTNALGVSYLWKRDNTPVTGSTTNSITITGSDVSTAGTYNYTVSAQNSAGCSSDDSAPIALKLSPKPTTPTITPVSLTANLVCGTDFKTLTATAGSAKYNWKRGNVLIPGPGGSTATNTLTVTGTDITTGGAYIYTVFVENSVGCSSDDSQPGVILQLFPSVPVKPIVTASGVSTFCEGNSVTLNYTTVQTTDTKIWSRTTGADTTTTNTGGITVRGSNTFTVKTKDANGCTSLASTPFVVTVNPLPSPPLINKGATDAICESDSITLVSNNKGTGSYLWSTGRTTTSITVRNAGSYSLTYTDANTCTSLPSTPLVLTINPLPAKPTIVNLSKSEFCFRESTTLRAASATTGTSFEWDYQNRTGNQIDVSGSSKKTVDEIIRVSVRALSTFANSSVNNVCKSRESSDVTTITVLPLPTTPIITAGGPITVCPDSIVVLTSSVSPTEYVWTIAKDNFVFGSKRDVFIDKTGRYFVQTISAKGCKSDTSANINVTIREAPQPASILSNPSSATVCLGGKVTMKALVANGNVAKYSWRDETTQQEVSTDQEINVSTTGSFSVRVRDVFGCFAPYSKPLKVSISPLPVKPTISIIKSKVFCDEDSTVVQASFASTTPNGNRNVYSWIVDGQRITESFSRQFSWKKASVISVAVTDSNGCKALLASDTIRTTVNPLPSSPSITVRGAIPFCADKNVTLSAIGANGTTYKWSTGATTPNINTNTAGSITVQAINGFGCISKPSQAISVRVNPLPTTPKLTANGETTFCDGSKVRIVSSSPFQTFWFRSPTDSIGRGEDLSSIFASKTGNYFAKVQDDNGCVSVASATLLVDVRPNPTPTIIKQIGTFTLDAQGVGDENGYLWRLAGDLQKDLTTRTIKAKKDGEYAVQASITYTNVALAGGRLVCYSKTSTPIKYTQDLSFEGMSIFPNPTSNGEINVEVIEDLIGAEIVVYDLYGQLIDSYVVDKFNTLKKIQLPDYHGNTYIVKITAGGYEKTRKIITLK